MWMYEVVKSLEEHVVAVHPNTSQQRCIKMRAALIKSSQFF